MKLDRTARQSFGAVSKACVLLALICFSLTFPTLRLEGQDKPQEKLELSRAARPWEFVSALGTRAGLLGNESGTFEAWVYPLKILRNLQLQFKVEDQLIPAKAIVRSVTVRPEATTITYAWDTFSVRETLFVPVHEAGAIIQLEIDAAQPLQIDAEFERDFQLEWPGAMGGSDIEWNPALHAFSLTENQQKFTALVGSPSALDFHLEYVTNYTSGKQDSFGFGIIPAGRTTKTIVIAASFDKLPAADVTYKKLSANYEALLKGSADYYQDYLEQHINLHLPDAALQQAYEWAQVSVLQGLVTNPYLGTGLVAGYRASGEDQRPGYAWFFGRDALWTSLGLDAEGDFATTKTALEFLAKYQRADGKVTHEIAQGASFVPWFNSMPYAYASADATPLFIIATADYVLHSGDISFAKQRWNNLWTAYQFIVSTYDATTGLPRNEGVGHGWIEGGPLYPAKTELYQTAVVVEALKSLGSLAKLTGQDDLSKKLNAEYEQKKQLINSDFWLPEESHFALSLDSNGKKVETLSVLGTVPMWFGLLDETKADPMISQLSDPDIQTDWGMRIIPAHTPKYDSAGYHSGTVWPLFTGWAAVGEYKYHHASSAYANLRANALLTFDGSLGHVTEVLTGNYYQTLSTGSPHQVWSSSMVISSMLTGLLGIEANGLNDSVSFTSHIPEDWKSFEARNIQAGSCLLDIGYRKLVDKRTFELNSRGNKQCVVDLSPAISERSQVTRVELNGRAISYHVRKSLQDQHVDVHVEASHPVETLVIHLKDDFGLTQESSLPELGSTNQGLRVISETWTPDGEQLTLQTSSAADGTFQLNVWNASEVVSVDGATLVKSNAHEDLLRIVVPPAVTGTSHQHVIVLHFGTVGHPSGTAAESKAMSDGTNAQ